MGLEKQFVIEIAAGISWQYGYVPRCRCGRVVGGIPSCRAPPRSVGSSTCTPKHKEW